MIKLLIAALAAWRLTNLFTYEEGPARVFVKIRAVSARIGGPMDCFWCVSVWAGFISAFLTGGRGRIGKDAVHREWLARALAASAGAILIDDARSKLHSP